MDTKGWRIPSVACVQESLETLSTPVRWEAKICPSRLFMPAAPLLSRAIDWPLATASSEDVCLAIGRPARRPRQQRHSWLDSQQDLGGLI